MASRLCSACQTRPATRTLRSKETGAILAICQSCPTPIELRQRAAAIRRTWPPDTRSYRKTVVRPQDLDEPREPI